MSIKKDDKILASDIVTVINDITTSCATKEELALVEEALSLYATKTNLEESLPNIVYMD